MKTRFAEFTPCVVVVVYNVHSIILVDSRERAVLGTLYPYINTYNLDSM